MQRKKQAYTYAEPLENEPFEWHFTLRGPPGTCFDGGIYHGLISLPYDYPFKPPYIIFFTPNGRFELHEKICLSFTNYHPEYWQPAWTIQSILLALVSFFPVNEEQLAIGAIHCSDKERIKDALRSPDWTCPQCKKSNREIADYNMLPLTESDGSELMKASAEMNLQFNKPAPKNKKEESKQEEPAEVPAPKA
jgi:ubiquitin-conjugating enzyme E2 J1